MLPWAQCDAGLFQEYRSNGLNAVQRLQPGQSVTPQTVPVESMAQLAPVGEPFQMWTQRGTVVRLRVPGNLAKSTISPACLISPSMVSD
jgi:hypothetical protein